MMLRRVLAWCVAGLAGLVVGAASAWATLEIGRASFSERVGQWIHNSAAGAQSADAYARAIIAREGLLALSASEALYFNLDRDENNRKLDESCIYELAGPNVDARWWSVTLYADDRFLVQNTDHAAAIDATRVRAGADGYWRARIAPVRGDAAHWLSSRNARRGFSLTLRIYLPGRDFRPSQDTLPALRTLSCAGAAV